MAYETILRADDMSMARVLITALRAHGFHPFESGDGGLPGVPAVFGQKGVPIEVPEEEATDARLLAEDLLREMREQME
ncbi:hypothetical protein GCM10007989_20210 [Devosia pacifica]|uniref:DUF2007 domain-containing protein n=1 Tax=Devosia pacifica TaxID=1335967 RepID=A0A918S7H5_9HYPH|nr:hypothetical protein [Devosia pacifica]GHA24500.1 hypothetical protein GCM10007989_20210 [Devosia pacifica]